MTSELNDELVHHWVTGWAKTHAYDVSHEENVHSALRSGDADAWEYVMYVPPSAVTKNTDETAEEGNPVLQTLRKAASSVVKSQDRLLTIITGPDTTVELSATGESLQKLSDIEKLMVVDMETQDVEDPITPEGFAIQRENFEGWTLVTVVNDSEEDEQVAARGRVAVVGNYAILDRIYTSEDFRRMGLGTFVTRALIAIALENDVDEGLLVATEDGRELYEYLGWTLLGDVHVYGAPGIERTTGETSHSLFDDLTQKGNDTR